MWLRVPFTKEELGRALGRTSVAVAAITDIGLAAAAARRLAELDPARYEESAARLDVKAQRAAERRAEQLAHEKNLRQGKKRVKKVPHPAEAPPPKTVRSRIAGSPSGSQPKSRPSTGNRPKPRAKPNPYAHSRPVKKGKGSFRKKES